MLTANDGPYLMRRAWPRQLVVYDGINDEWVTCTDENVLKRIKYLAISYRQADWEQTALEEYIRTICGIFFQSDPPAYWLDFACIGKSQEDLDYDLYRMADVFRYADETLIVIQNKSDGWQRWGERVWTLPEALLGDSLNYVIPGKKLDRHVDLTKIANLAYSRRLFPEEWELIDAYRSHGKDPLTAAERMELGWIAINNRTIGLGTESNIEGYKADKVYALMGLFKNRIEPNRDETEAEAFNRLLQSNELCQDPVSKHIFDTTLAGPSSTRRSDDETAKGKMRSHSSAPDTNEKNPGGSQDDSIPCSIPATKGSANADRQQESNSRQSETPDSNQQPHKPKKYRRHIRPYDFGSRQEMPDYYETCSDSEESYVPSIASFSNEAKQLSELADRFKKFTVHMTQKIFSKGKNANDAGTNPVTDSA